MSSEQARAEALAQFQLITNQQNAELSRQILAATDWNVEAAVARLYDEPASVGREEAEEAAPLLEDEAYPARTFAANTESREHGNRSMFTAFARGNFTQIVALPFRILFSILTPVFVFIGRLLRLPRVNIASFSLRPLFNPSGHSNIHRLDPATCASRTIQQLEEDLGITLGNSDAYSTSVEAGPSTLKSPTRSGTGNPRLPNLYVGSYDSALRTAKEEVKPLLVILFTSEHENAAEFKRKVLLDTNLRQTLEQRQFVTWIGDVKYSDAYQTSRILEATTFPFFAFITLSPSRTASGASSAPKMTVFSRLEGPPSTTTAPGALIEHINGTVIPRTSSFMDRIRREKHARDAERAMREEQDRAYEEAANRDVERIRAKERQLEQSRLDEARRASSEQERAVKQGNVKLWRQWAAQHLVPPEPTSNIAKSSTTRLSVKLPDGRRLMRAFLTTATLEEVYAWVDTSAFPIGSSTNVARPPPSYVHNFDFTLLNMFPRKSIPFRNGTTQTLDSIDGMCPSASLVVEGMQLDSSHSDADEEEEED